MLAGFVFFKAFATMVGTRATNKLKRSNQTQEEGEYISLDESDSETESIDWDELIIESAAAGKGKAPVGTKAKTPSIPAEKGKAPMEPTPMKRKTVAKRKGRARGIEVTEPPPKNVVHISSERIKAFKKHEFIGERHVNVAALKERSSLFGTLFDQSGIAPICNFLESTGYCLHLVRTFYSCATQLADVEDGPKEFHTMVRNVKLKITPQVI